MSKLPSTRRFVSLCVSAISAGMVFATPLAAREVRPVEVNAPPPTTVVVAVAGLTVSQVRHRVTDASAYVCRNAITNRDLQLAEEGWCQFHTFDRAMGRYYSAVHRGVRLAEIPIVVSAG